MRRPHGRADMTDSAALTDEPQASLAVRWRRGEQVHIQAQTGHGLGDGADGVEQL
jgi:hypothetical protein